MSGAPAGDLVFGVIQTLGGNRDGDILGLRDRATKALYHCPLGRRCTFLRTEEFYPLGCLYPSKSLGRKLYIRTARGEERHHLVLKVAISNSERRLPKLSNDSPISGNGYRFLIVRLLRPL